MAQHSMAIMLRWWAQRSRSLQSFPSECFGEGENIEHDRVRPTDFRISAAHYDISDHKSSSSSNDWAIPFHFGCAEEDGPSLDETHAFVPETLREIEKAILRGEVALDDMD